MYKLVTRIREQFSNDAVIEIYVLDEMGKPYEMYSGLPSGLKLSIFEEVLVNPGTFYVFSVVAIDESYADLIDLNRNKMTRKEFCWLTDPLAPVAYARTESSLTLQWNPVQMCGVDISAIEDSITYVLEGCEGQEYRRGISSKFISDISISREYKLLCKGNHLTQVEIDDLKPSTFYHFRLTLEYNGIKMRSPITHYATTSSFPSQPLPPSISLIKNENSMFSNRGRFDPKVHVSWMPVVSNGSSIQLYHVQLQEIIDKDKCPSDILSNSTYFQDQNDGIIKSRWQTVFCNVLLNMTLPPPTPACCGWNIRYRAKNAFGWSEFSSIVSLTSSNFPTVFRRGKCPPPLAAKPNSLPPIDMFENSHSHSSTASKEKSVECRKAFQRGAHSLDSGYVDRFNSSSVRSFSLVGEDSITSVEAKESSHVVALSYENDNFEHEQKQRNKSAESREEFSPSPKKQQSTAPARVKSAPSRSTQAGVSSSALITPVLSNRPSSYKKNLASALDNALLKSYGKENMDSMSEEVEKSPAYRTCTRGGGVNGGESAAWLNSSVMVDEEECDVELTSEILETDIDRIWQRTSINRDFIRYCAKEYYRK